MSFTSLVTESGKYVNHMVDYLLLILSFLLIIVGLLGCVLPVIPGPPLSFAGLLVVHFSKFAHFDPLVLILAASFAAIVTVLDYIVPVWGTKKFGGTKYGTWGSAIGLIIGLFFSPFSAFLSILIGPFLGAVIGELIGGMDSKHALKAGLGAFIGFLLGTGLKLIVSIGITIYYFSGIWSNIFQS